MHKYKVRNRILYQWIIYLVVLLFAVSVFRVNFRLEKSTSESMEPTIMVGDYGFTYLKAYSKKSVPRHGDLVVFHFMGSIVGKRVIGTPGDVISFKRGYVYRNGIQLKDDYLPSASAKTYCKSTFKVPTECIFVLGDNREVSYDSRFWDNPYIPYSDIIGKILFIIPTHYFNLN